MSREFKQVFEMEDDSLLSSSSSDGEMQYPSPAKSSRKSPSRSKMEMAADSTDDNSVHSDESDFDFDDDVLAEESLWKKYATNDSTSSKNERKTKALNNEVMKRLQNHRSKAKKIRLSKATPEFDPEDSFKLSPELKVGDFLSGDYTREIQLKNGLLRDLCGLWRSKEMCDVTIECEDGPIQAHKLMLSARSDVFRAMFESGMTEASSNIVKIDDVKVQTMNILVQFMYTGRIAPLTVVGMTDLIIAADKYQMVKLKEACFYELVRKMNSRNVGEIMLLAHTHNCSADIKLSIQRFLLSERQALWKVAEFQEVAKTHPMVITTFLFEDFSFTALVESLPIGTV